MKDVETRVINWLLKHAAVGRSDDATIKLPMTKRVLAAELGTSSETLSRTFARLREKDLLAVKGNVLRLQNPDALRARFRQLLGES